jgi:hypothetical protein
VAAPQEYAAAVEAAWTEHLRGEHRQYALPRDYVYASGRRSCVRRMVLDMTHPEDEGPPDAARMERFSRGNEREQNIVARLFQIGPRATPPFHVVEGQRPFRVRDRDGLLLISGRIDGRLAFGHQYRPIFEVTGGDSYRAVKALPDLDRSPWTSHKLDQLLCYMLAEAEPHGLLVIERTGNIPLFLPVALEEHLERAEGFLRDARAAVLAAKAEAPLPPWTQDAAECRRCPHLGASCTPPSLSYGPGARVIDDERLVRLAEECEELRPAAKRHDKAWDELRGALRGTELAIIGPYVAHGKWKSRTEYRVPAEVKASYKTVIPEGSFEVELERVVQRPTESAPAEALDDEQQEEEAGAAPWKLRILPA